MEIQAFSVLEEDTELYNRLMSIHQLNMIQQVILWVLVSSSQDSSD